MDGQIDGKREADRQTNRKGSRNSQQLNWSLHFLCHDSCRICINQLWPEFQNILLDVIQGNDPISCQLKLSRNLEMFCCAAWKDNLIDTEKSQNPSLYKWFRYAFREFAYVIFYELIFLLDILTIQLHCFTVHFHSLSFWFQQMHYFNSTLVQCLSLKMYKI
jgi:hypothetical protein